MTTVNLYREKDLKVIDDNIDDIVNKARKQEITILDPKLSEYKKVMEYLENFIKRKGRVVYGGWAWHSLIEYKNKDDGIYDKDRCGYPDLEFYSPEPVKDLVEICNDLHGKDFKYVQGIEAEHVETYSLFANFVNYADISYIPNIIVNSMPIMTINGMKFAHPKFILVDILRMYTDPLTSYWRVKKNMLRANKLLSYWGINISENAKLTKIDVSQNRNILDYVRKEILPLDKECGKLVVFGHYAYQYYKYKANNSQSMENMYVPHYDVISTELANDAKKIYDKLKKHNSHVQVEEYHPYFQFFDSRICFKINGKIILNVYGNNCKCVPYVHLQKKNINISTFQVTIMNLLVSYLYNRTHRNKVEMNSYDFMLGDIIELRNKYLKNNNKSIFDDSPFQEFILQCLGEGHNAKREWMIGVKEKKLQKKRPRFTFDPSNKSSKNYDPSTYFFKNSSGKINTSRNKVFSQI